MKRTTSICLSLGMSAVLIAIAVRLLYNHNVGIWHERSLWASGHHGMMGGGMGIVMIIFWILLIGAVVLLISGAINGIRGSNRRADNKPDPLEILKQRYARGEINQAEYEGKRRELIT